MFLALDWWISLVCLAGVLLTSCSGVNVFVRDEKKYSVLFQTVVLPCQYNSVSTQIPVVQWVYKSYCRDRTRDSFNLYDSPGGGLGTRGSGSVGIKVGGGGYETRVMASYLDCSDNSRTVRTVASISGSSITLSEYYKNRDISIINKADLRIGEVQWGDSGVYICKVVISDDLEGQNEASVELLVLGFSGVPEDLLPDIDLKIMPEWVFVTAVALGTVLFILFFGICWCQCCPHSCCCYVSCWCCPDTCCCPRHLYEAGKGIKTRTATPQTPAYPPYFVTGVPTMLPIAPPSLVDKISSVPPSEGTMLSTAPMHAVGLPYRVPSPQDQDSLRLLQYVEKQLAHFNPAASISRQSCSLSELSSLHEGENGFHHTYRNIQKKALPTIPDQDPQPETQRFCNNRSPIPQRLVDHGSPEHQRYCDKPPSPKRFNDHGEPAHQRRHSDDHSLPSQLQRPGCDQQRHLHDREDKHNRWNPRSEHLERKTYRAAERRGSLDELEEFASFHKLRAGRGTEKKAEDYGEYEMERLEYCRYPSHRNGPPQHYYEEENELRGNANEDHTRRGRKNKNNISPLPSPQRRRGTWDNDRPVPAPPTVSPSSSAQEKDYDAVFLNSLLERKAKLRGFGKSKNADDSDTPSKGSSKKSSSESTRYCGHSPSNRPEVDSLPPHLDTGRSRTDRQSPRPPAARSSPSPCLSVPNSREESRDRSRKVFFRFGFWLALTVTSLIMPSKPAAALLLLSLLKVCVCIQVIVPQQQRSTALFASVTLRCDYSTSASSQDVILTWRYKSFCKDPVLEYYSTAYQSALQLGQDPANDCPDRQRKVRTVVQKRGSSEPILGSEYRERKISIQNKADLVINEVMWWDNGVYFCSVDAAGDTTGDSDKEIKLIVYHWLTVLFIVIGALLLIILFGVCCCQCCPQSCCCYVRCPCCPQQCCCPEKAVMQHRMMKEAQRAMNPWLGGQPVYAPMSHVSSQMNPLLYPGTSSANSVPLKPMPLPHPQSSAYSVPAPSIPSSHTPANNHMLDYLESQVRGMDMNSPLLVQSQPPPPQHMQQMPPPQHRPVNVPFSPGPPSMISALDDGPKERRVINLPPIREPQNRLAPPAPRTRPPSSSESSRSGFGRREDRDRRYPSPPRSRGIPRSYSQDSLDARSHYGARGGMDLPRSRSRDDLYDSRSRGNYSPPASRHPRRGSWSSDDEGSRRGGGGGGGRRGGAGGGWVDKPPSYTEYEPGQKPGARKNDRYADKNSRSGNSIVI